MLLPTFKLPKEERLSGEKKIRELFTKGSSFFAYPFKVVYIFVKTEENKTEEENKIGKENKTGEGKLEVAKLQVTKTQLLFSVPKKKFKKATQRNRIRRQIKEAYRLNKHVLVAENGYFQIGLIYTQATAIAYKEIEKGVINSLQKIKRTQQK